MNGINQGGGEEGLSVPCRTPVYSTVNPDQVNQVLGMASRPPGGVPRRRTPRPGSATPAGGRARPAGRGPPCATAGRGSRRARAPAATPTAGTSPACGPPRSSRPSTPGTRASRSSVHDSAAKRLGWREHRDVHAHPAELEGGQGRHAGIAEGGADGVVGHVVDQRPAGLDRADAAQQPLAVAQGDERGRRRLAAWPGTSAGGRVRRCDPRAGRGSPRGRRRGSGPGRPATGRCRRRRRRPGVGRGASTTAPTGAASAPPAGVAVRPDGSVRRAGCRPLVAGVGARRRRPRRARRPRVDRRPWRRRGRRGRRGEHERPVARPRGPAGPAVSPELRRSTSSMSSRRRRAAASRPRRGKAPQASWGPMSSRRPARMLSTVRRSWTAALA